MKSRGIHTEKISLWNGIFQTELPIGFEVAKEELVMRKFPYTYRPEYIWSKEDSQIFTFNLLHKALSNAQVEDAILAIQQMIKRRYPSSISDYACCPDKNGIFVGYFSFLTGGIPCGEYHIMLVIPVDNMMMLETYHCNDKNMKQAREMVFYMLERTKINKIPR